MLIAIVTSPCIFSIGSRNMTNSRVKSNSLHFMNVFLHQSVLSIFFRSFNPNGGYGKQWRLFYGNLPGIFLLIFCYFFSCSIVILDNAGVIFVLIEKGTSQTLRYFGGAANGNYR